MADVPSNLIPTRITQLPDAPVADENSLVMIIYQGNNYKIRVGDLLSVSGVPNSRQVIAGTGLTGGGQLVSNVTLSIANGGVGTTQLANSGVAAGSYGNATAIPTLTVDSTGRVVSASTSPLNAAAPGANSDITSLSSISGGVSTPEYVTFDTSPATTPSTAGTIYWSDEDANQTLAMVMADGVSVQHIGQESCYRVKATSAVTKGQVVMFTGSVGASGGLTAAPATGLTATQGEYVMGVAAEDIPLNGWGYVTAFGSVRGVNTTGGAESWVDGQILYYNPSVVGGLTKNAPSKPNAIVQVCAVVHAAVNGSLFVRPVVFPTLDGLCDVSAGSASNGDLISWNSSNSRWQVSSPSALSVASATNIAGGAASQIVYQSGAGVTAFLANGSAGQVLKSNSSSAPSWSGVDGGTF